ncbi:acetyltransferase [Mesobacillus campisalis]|uniref:Acetyltransferase n=1 Tax=Mesobacillus campisalis TaxID=1408103 RepID=A0A0M2SWF4_9BACI|nr:GNAT family N-acetyltransferase [Mesobacillus campisalis]KKK38498.1 acetyltransferase [Mesobacillus campisalis]
MIRKLLQADHQAVTEFLSEEPSINLFIIGDIEAFGYDTEFQELWGEFSVDARLKAVLLRYHNSFIPYAKEDFDVEGFAGIIKLLSKEPVLSGKSAIVEQFEKVEGIQLGKKQQTHFAECRNGKFLGTSSQSIQKAGIGDVDRIINLRQTIEEFTVNENARLMLRQALETGTGRTYFLEYDGALAACASTAAENSVSAMIVGVCTHKEHRQKGLATAVMQRLFKDVLEEGKTLCLFYDNPAAGRIYKRLGFQDIGKWTMYR